MASKPTKSEQRLEALEQRIKSLSAITSRLDDLEEKVKEMSQLAAIPMPPPAVESPQPSPQPEETKETEVAFDFPSNPAQDQIFTDAATGVTYKWDGQGWQRQPDQ